METRMVRYKGIRAREAGEKCPKCKNPGSGMVLDTKGTKFVDKSWEWICTRCKK